MARALDIISYNNDLAGLASLDRFTWRDGGEVASEIVIREKNVSPYCVDPVSRRLIFVDLPPDLDLASVPFAYLAQKRYARRLIAVPYAELPDLASRVDWPPQLVFVFNVARCGSTLMHRMLNQVDGVRCFAELDVFTNMIPLAQHAEERSALRGLLADSVKLFAYPYADGIVAFKGRGQDTDIADLVHETFPEARCLFLYRNAIDWSASWRRLDIQNGTTEVNVGGYRDALRAMYGRSTDFDVLVPPEARTIPSMVAWLHIWLMSVEGYLRAREAGVPFLTLRYEDLDAHREAMAARVFDYVGIPLEGVAQALRGFEKDAQAGTALARKDGVGNQLTLDDAARAMVVQALAKHPRRLAPDVILPETIRP